MPTLISFLFALGIVLVTIPLVLSNQILITIAWLLFSLTCVEFIRKLHLLDNINV